MALCPLYGPLPPVRSLPPFFPSTALYPSNGPLTPLWPSVPSRRSVTRYDPLSSLRPSIYVLYDPLSSLRLSVSFMTSVCLVLRPYVPSTVLCPLYAPPPFTALCTLYKICYFCLISNGGALCKGATPLVQ
jgi:hypothetical protein